MSAEPVRGTQSVVGQMGWVFARPSLTALEIAWRWLFGAPVLYICWLHAQKILADLPPDTTGLNSLDPGNPWLSAVKIAAAWDMYRPHVAAILVWLAPLAAIAWIVLSGVGRNLVLKRMEPRLRLRPFSLIALQAVWLALLTCTIWAWYRSVGLAAHSHIGNGADPDLVGYFMWVIFLSIGFFVFFGLVSWFAMIAPMLLLLEDCSIPAALSRSVRLGKPFTSKLVEINLVMGIVTIALLVVAMVFSSVLIPFADQVGVGALHIEWVIVSVFYFVAADYFQVVRLKGFVEFWHTFRGSRQG